MLVTPEVRELVKAATAKAERKIVEVLRELEAETGCRVEDIRNDGLVRENNTRTKSYRIQLAPINE